MKVEDLFPYVESKEKLVNDKILKRARFKEALEQIEAALSGEDPSPISTQVSENGGDGDKVDPAVVTEAAAEANPLEADAIKPDPPKASAAKTPRQNNNAQSAKDSKAAVKNKVITDAKPTADIDETITKPEPIPGDDLPQTKVDPAGDPIPDESLSPEVEITSRSGRKIKPKK